MIAGWFISQYWSVLTLLDISSELSPSITLSSERLTAGLAWRSPAHYLSYMLSPVLVSFNSALLSFSSPVPRGLCLGHIIIQYLQECHLKNVTITNDKNSGFAWIHRCPTDHFGIFRPWCKFHIDPWIFRTIFDLVQKKPQGKTVAFPKSSKFKF